MWSQRIHYAVRALTALTGHHGTTISVRRIAEEERIPQKYLEVVMGELRDAGLVHSTKGKSGGYRLVRDPSTVRLSTVIAALDPSFVAELTGSNDEGDSPTTPILTEMCRRLWAELSETTLADALHARQQRTRTIDYSI